MAIASNAVMSCITACIPARIDRHPASLSRFADQIEIGCSKGAFGHREVSIPPTSTHARSLGKKDCDGL